VLMVATYHKMILEEFTHRAFIVDIPYIFPTIDGQIWVRYTIPICVIMILILQLFPIKPQAIQFLGIFCSRVPVQLLTIMGAVQWIIFKSF